MLTESRKEGLTILGKFMRMLAIGLLERTEFEGLELRVAEGAISYVHDDKYVITVTTNISVSVQEQLSTLYCFLNNKNIIVNKEYYSRSPDEDFFALSTVLDKLYFERLFVTSLLHDVVLPNDEYCILIDDFNVSTFLAGVLKK